MLLPLNSVSEIAVSTIDGTALHFWQNILVNLTQSPEMEVIILHT